MKSNPIANQNGFSVVEMMLAILISGMIMGVVGTFLVVHVKSFKVNQEIVDVQYDGQIVLNQMVKIAMQSEGIYSIDNDMGTPNALDATGSRTPFLLVFNNSDGSYDVFFSLNSSLYYQNTTSLTDFNMLTNTSALPTTMSKMCDNINVFRIIPTEGADFRNTRSIEIALEIQNNEIQLTSSTQVKFRNK